MKFAKSLLLITTLLLLIAPASYAYPVSEGEWITLKNGTYGTTPGGEFDIYLAGEYKFTTFCLEKDEYINPNGSAAYRVTSISDTVWNGGVNTNYGDPLSDSTKWLYWHYVTGDLDDLVAGFTYSDAGANAVQYAIWKIEQEITTALSGLNNTVYTAALNYMNNANSTIGDVKAMNLKDEYGRYAQSQLIYQPPVTVPEPTAMILLGTGLLGLAGISRKRFHKKG